MGERESQQVNAKAHEAVDHLTSFWSSRDEISQPRIELWIFSLRFGYLSIIMQ
jgi:hypothetical protein